MLTIDANVFVAAEIRSEPEYTTARRLIADVLGRGLQLHLPWLAVVEASVAVGRRLGSEKAATKLADAISTFPGVVLHPLDRELALLSIAVGANCRLRGADSVYAAVAKRHGTVFITCDDELRRRTAGTIEALTPETWLEQRG